MKLRNKKTGQIFDWDEDCIPFGFGLPHPKTLAELNDTFEDYEPKEPLIKDEKIRRAVRVWWDTLDKRHMRSTKVLYQDKRFYVGIYVIDCGRYIELENIKDGDYTIEELCGEEEE